MNTVQRALLIALAAAAGACDFLRDPTSLQLDEESVVVHAVLSAGAEQASVLVTRVSAASEPVIGQTYPFGPGIEPVSAAEVRLVSGSDTLLLAEAAPGLRACYLEYIPPDGDTTTTAAGKGCYAARVPGGIRAGAAYSLRIRLPDGRTIEGEAVSPAMPQVVEPEPHHRIVLSRDRVGRQQGVIRVRVRPGAAGSGLALWLHPTAAAYRGGSRANDVRCGVGSLRLAATPGDTATITIDGFGCYKQEGTNYTPVTPDSVHATLYVTAYDAAAVRYQTAVQREQTTAAAVTQGITGALGLFGSEATVQRTVTLVPG